MRRRIVVSVLTVASVLGLASCTHDDPAPNYSTVSPAPSSASTSSSPTASPTPTVPTTGPNVSPGETPPTAPAAAAQNTPEGAQAFVGYYMKTLDWVYATSDPSILSPFYSENCATCVSGQRFIADLVADGATVRGGRIEVLRLGEVANDGRAGATMAVSAELSVSEASVVDGSGATATSFPATPNVTLTEWLTWAGAGWRIVEERYA